LSRNVAQRLCRTCGGYGGKAPLQSQCQRLLTEGCNELVDGVLLSVQGDKTGATQQLLQVKQENTPADLERGLDSTGRHMAPTDSVDVQALATAPTRVDPAAPTAGTVTTRPQEPRRVLPTAPAVKLLFGPRQQRASRCGS
jgi:hypothetical protein